MLLDGPTDRATLVGALVRAIARLNPGQLLRVALDGPDTAGKTTLADELAEPLRAHRPVIRAGIDGFHRPRAERVRRGSLSPEAFFHDSFDYDALRSVLLAPLGPGGSGRYRTAVFDHRRDLPVAAAPRLAPRGAVLLFDGIFLLRPELREQWDLSIFVDVEEAEVLRRAVARDADLMGGPEIVRERYLHRYIPGQRLYRTSAAPVDTADIVIDNNRPTEPHVSRWFGRAGGA